MEHNCAERCPKCGYPSVDGKHYRGMYKVGMACGYCGFREHYSPPASAHRESTGGLDKRATTAERKQEVLSKLLDIWQQYPQLRFCQLLYIVTNGVDIFNIEDFDLVAFAQDWNSSKG